MRVPTRPRQRGLRFNITPLIDVIFLLIIFFLAATHFVRNEKLEAVELPEATQQEEQDETPRRLVITITADEKLHVGPKDVQLLDVEQMILAGQLEADAGGFEVRIRADRSVPYSQIEPIMLACAAAGVTNVKFAVLLK